MTSHLRLLLMIVLIPWVAPSQAGPKDAESLLRLLETQSCPHCQLEDVDLVHADLRDADLNGASLKRANLSQVNLDGANLHDADLSFSTLRGASLRGADLRGSRLHGADLRNADLSGAQLDALALETSHWQGAKGIPTGIHSHAALHNAGVEATQTNLWRDAERLFSDAIRRKPTEPLSWVARGLCRGELGNINKAVNDFMHAATLFEQEGDLMKAEQLRTASRLLTNNDDDEKDSTQGNGLGSSVLEGTLSVLQSLAPLALRAFTPFVP